MTLAETKSQDLAWFVETGRHLTEIYGTAWGDFDTAEVRSLVNDWIMARLGLQVVALEIGAGGGRWSRTLVGQVAHAILVDGTPLFETAIRQHADWPGFSFHVAPEGLMPFLESGTVDYCFSFDTFVHFETPLFEQYLDEIGRVLKCGGILHLHYARYWPENQHPDPRDFTYRDEALVGTLLNNAGMSLTGRRREQRIGNGSVYVEAVKQ